MQKAFPWLCGFIASQLALMAVAAIPLERWRSFGTTALRRTERVPEFISSEVAVKVTAE
jgi:predicted lysophospholipase L1 biosynthesis ABC-type transport system permease subunit